jgi:hypothetical protein
MKARATRDSLRSSNGRPGQKRNTATQSGVLLFHISNRFVDLKPALARLAVEEGLDARFVYDDPDGVSGNDSAERLKPKPRDCCVFCSYGSMPCPPIQADRSGETGAAPCRAQ